jgi:hypothetical protein
MKVNGAHISDYFLNLKMWMCSSKFKYAYKSKNILSVCNYSIKWKHTKGEPLLFKKWNL